MNIKKLLTIVGVLAILVAALPAGAAFAQGPSGQNPPLGLGRGNWGGPDNSLVAVAAKILGFIGNCRGKAISGSAMNAVKCCHCLKSAAR